MLAPQNNIELHLELMEDYSQGRLRVYVRLVVLTVSRLACEPQTALTAILLGFNDGHRSRTCGGLQRSAGAATCPGVRASTARRRGLSH